MRLSLPPWCGSHFSRSFENVKLNPGRLLPRHEDAQLQWKQRKHLDSTSKLKCQHTTRVLSRLTVRTTNGTLIKLRHFKKRVRATIIRWQSSLIQTKEK